MFSYLKPLKEKHYIFFCLYYMGYQLNSSRIQYFLSYQIFFYDLIFKVTTMSEINFCTGLISNRLEQGWSDSAAAAKSLQSCLTLCDPMDCSPPGLFHSKGFTRQEYWSELLSPPPGELPNPGIKPRSPTFQADSTI